MQCCILVCFVCCVFDGVCELFGEIIRNVFVILLLNVMELCVVGGALLDRPCMFFHIMCVLSTMFDCIVC